MSTIIAWSTLVGLDPVPPSILRSIRSLHFDQMTSAQKTVIMEYFTISLRRLFSPYRIPGKTHVRQVGSRRLHLRAPWIVNLHPGCVTH